MIVVIFDIGQNGSHANNQCIQPREFETCDTMRPGEAPIDRLILSSCANHAVECHRDKRIERPSSHWMVSLILFAFILFTCCHGSAVCDKVSGNGDKNIRMF